MHSSHTQASARTQLSLTLFLDHGSQVLGKRRGATNPGLTEHLGLLLLQGHPTPRGARSVLFHMSFFTFSPVHPFPLYLLGLGTFSPPSHHCSPTPSRRQWRKAASPGFRWVGKRHFWVHFPFPSPGRHLDSPQGPPLLLSSLRTAGLVLQIHITGRYFNKSHNTGDKTA